MESIDAKVVAKVVAKANNIVGKSRSESGDI